MSDVHPHPDAIPEDISVLEPSEIVGLLKNAACKLAEQHPELARQLILSSFAIACDEGVLMAMLHNGVKIPDTAVRIGVRRELTRRQIGMDPTRN